MPTRIDVLAGDITQLETRALVVNLFQGVTVPGGATGAVDRALGGAISRLIQDGEIKGKLGELTLLHTLGRLAPARVVVAGLGPADKFTEDMARRVAGDAARFLRQKGVKRAMTVAHGAGQGGLAPQAAGQALAEGALLGLYRFDKYRSRSDAPELETLTIVERDPERVAAIARGVETGRIVAEGVNLARDLVNEPPNTLTPTRMAAVAGQTASGAGLEWSALEREHMRELGMGALLGVAQGSHEPPKLIILQYQGDPGHPENSLGLVGKGITFDSGGLSLKTADGMQNMKGDMAGGAAVIGAMQIIGKLRPRLNVTGLIAATENMPGGGAQRPGDVVRAMNGKTIEVLNTDAEGRLVLADALCYAHKLGLTRLVDVATLTGAMSVTLGRVAAGVMGNDQPWIDQVIQAGQQTGERFWQLPMYDEYKELIRSDVADMKNVGGRGAGSITAACLLGEFVDGAAWAHLDIAGTARAENTGGYTVKGATGFPARSLVALALRLAAG